MELKAFKGMPHEFGGIDYTEGSEVEGGEFAVQIGKNGNEYIFDKNSSEGERLSKEYKRLDKNGRLTEDDPLALETFDQIAREEALKHAQRSVNEKGIDPFRNMYDQGGQAANGGVKYATGGPMMNPAEVPNVNPGAQYNTSMSYAPKTAEEYFREQTGASRMRDSFGTQTMREEPTQKGFKEIGAAKEAGLLIGDIFFGYPMASFTGKSFSETVMADQGYSSSDLTKRMVGDDTMTGTAFGYGQMQSQNVISNMGGQVLGGMADGGAMPKNKYAQGGAKDIYQMGGGMPWLQMVKAVKGIKDSSAQLAGSAMDQTIADKMGEEYITDKIGGPRQTIGGGNFAAFGNIDNFNPKTSELPSSPEGTITYGGMSYAPDTMGPFPIDATVSQGGTEVPVWKNGGAKPIYGYYANGGGSGSVADQIENIREQREIGTLSSGITYQDLQGGRFYPVYDDMGNEIQGRRNIGASSLSPAFDIQENFIPRESTPQGYVPVNHDPYGNYDLNEESHFMHLRKPPRQSKLTRDLNAEQGFNLYADPVKNAPNVKSTSTLINNETGKSYNFKNGGGKSYTDKIKEAEDDLNQSLGNPMNKAFDDFMNELRNNPRLAGDDMYLDPYRHGMAGYYTADAIKKKMPSWMPESVANKLAIAGSTIAGVGHEFAAPSTERMGLVDALTEAGQDAYNNYVGAKMIEDVLFDREARQLMLDKIRREETYPGVVVSDTDPYVKRDNALQPVPFNPANLKTVKFQDGGGKKKEDEVTGVAVTPTGVAYSSDQMSTGIDYSRGLLDYLPPHVNQYLYTFFGGDKPFTEKQLRPQDIAAWQDILENRTIQDKYKDEVTRLEGEYDDEKYVSYDDFNRLGALPTEKITSSIPNIYKALTDPYTIAKLTAGKAQVADGSKVFGDWDFAKNKSFDELEGGADFLAYLWNLSPFIDDEDRKRQATKSGPNAAMQFTIPKRNK